MPENPSRPLVLAGTLASVAAIGYLDYLTGHDLGWYVFYFPPIAAAGWYLGRGPGLAVGVLCTAVWFLADRALGFEYSSAEVAVWNTGFRLTSFLLVGVASAWIRMALDRERATSRSLRAALAELKVLRGLLPICCQCKKIRDEQQRWHPVESYFQSHSEVSFSHGYCPDCYRALMLEAGLSEGEDPLT